MGSERIQAAYAARVVMVTVTACLWASPQQPAHDTGLRTGVMGTSPEGVPLVIHGRRLEDLLPGMHRVPARCSGVEEEGELWKALSP